MERRNFPATLTFPRRGMAFYRAIVSLVLTLAVDTGLYGQTTASSPPAQPNASATLSAQATQQEPVLQALQAKQLTLARQQRALRQQGATPQQMAAWHQQNAPQFAALGDLSRQLAATSALRVAPTNGQPNVPPNASQTLKDYLVNQCALGNARAQIHNQLVQEATATGLAMDSSQINQMGGQAMQQFAQQNAVVLQAQAQLGLALASESTHAPLQVPPLQIPANSTPEMAAFLTTRNQLMASRVQIKNQYSAADPVVREAAMQQWQQQNLALIQQMQQQAQSLSSSNQ